MLQPILDVQTLEDLEYFAQLAFFTADLHITRAWATATEDQVVRLRTLAKELQGPVVRSLVECSNVLPPVSFETVISTGTIPDADTRQMVFPLGALDAPPGFRLNPSGVYRFVLFDVALGLPARYTRELFGEASFRNATVPKHASSLLRSSALDAERTGAQRSSLYRAEVRVRSGDQALPATLMEVEFKPLRVETFVPVCEYCLGTEATVYCASDK